ncbi:unnamed protein product [Rhizophagus irregularis]|nr:unnamed protein product [Rhizophagus irregularis]
MVTHNGNFYCDSNKKRTMIYFLFSRLHHSSCKSFILYLIYSYSIFTIDDLISLIIFKPFDQMSLTQEILRFPYTCHNV